MSSGWRSRRSNSAKGFLTGCGGGCTIGCAEFASWIGSLFLSTGSGNGGHGPCRTAGVGFGFVGFGTILRGRKLKRLAGMLLGPPLSFSVSFSVPRSALASDTGEETAMLEGAALRLLPRDAPAGLSALRFLPAVFFLPGGARLKLAWLLSLEH